ncbi:MAG TPA: tetratricopeptide repeat protein [Kofleriaceae bacterium]
MRLLLVVLVGVAACGHAGAPRIHFPDAPIELADEADRAQAIDRFWALPPGPDRAAARGRIALAIASRITDAIEEDKPFVAESLLFELTSLWRDDPASVGKDLAGQAALIEHLRAIFAKSGSIEPAIATLVVLAEIEPARRSARLAELDEVLAFADDLAAAEHGANAQRAQPIALLQPTVLALPLPWLVDRYVGLLEDRQRAFAKLVDPKHPPTFELVRAQPDLLKTAHRIANALARAGRIAEIHAHLATLVGMYGTDRELDIRAEIVADRPTADAYADLARAVRGDSEAGDPTASLAICLRGLRDAPDDTELLAAAAGDAAEVGRVDQPIALFEAALQHERGEVDHAIAVRLGKLYAQRIARLAAGGRPGAATTAWRELAHYTDLAGQRAPSEVWRQVAAIGEASLGKGLVAQGQLADAEVVLRASLDRAPSIEAYETLASIYLETRRFAEARQAALRGAQLTGEQLAADRYHRAKLLRLAADASREAGKPDDAVRYYLESLRVWKDLGSDDDLPRAIAAERKLEAARELYAVEIVTSQGDPANAVDFALDALELDPDTAQMASATIAFLLEIDRPSDAADALHRALGSTEIGEPTKISASLWLVGDAKRRHATPDPFAVEYLASRHGELWYEQLAEAATHRLDFTALRASATTEPRRIELVFYGTALELDPARRTPAAARAAFEEVVRSGLVLDAIHDLALQYVTAARR